MEYMLLLHGDESAYASMSEAEQKGAFEAFMTYNKELAAAGVLRGGSELAPSPTATVVRGSGGEVLVTEGPFAESREQIGGYYVLEVPSRDEAVAWAKRCPIVFGGGAVEVRAVGTVPEELDG